MRGPQAELNFQLEQYKNDAVIRVRQAASRHDCGPAPGGGGAPAAPGRPPCLLTDPPDSPPLLPFTPRQELSKLPKAEMVVALRKTVDTEAELVALSTSQNGYSHFNDMRCGRGVAGCMWWRYLAVVACVVTLPDRASVLCAWPGRQRRSRARRVPVEPGLLRRTHRRARRREIVDKSDEAARLTSAAALAGGGGGLLEELAVEAAAAAIAAATSSQGSGERGAAGELRHPAPAPGTRHLPPPAPATLHLPPSPAALSSSEDAHPLKLRRAEASLLSGAAPPEPDAFLLHPAAAAGGGRLMGSARVVLPQQQPRQLAGRRGQGAPAA
jgi:hypothetical protein